MHSTWIVIFPLALSFDFYPVPFEPAGFVFGGYRMCPEIDMCDEDYLCNMWINDSTKGCRCFLGKPQNLTSTTAIKSYFKARTSNQCGDRDKYRSKQAVMDSFVEGFDCSTIFELDSLNHSSTTQYAFVDKRLNAKTATIWLDKDSSKAPFTKNNFWKYCAINIWIWNTATNYGYRIDNGPVKNFKKDQSKATDKIFAYCWEGKMYLDGENMKQQLTEFLVDGQRLLNL